MQFDIQVTAQQTAYYLTFNNLRLNLYYLQTTGCKTAAH